MVESDSNSLFSIFKEYHDKIVLHVAAHDHVADLRYHNSDLPFSSVAQSTSSNSDLFYFHNTLYSPGTTGVDGTNPGYATFRIDDSSLIPSGLKMTFINTQKTYGWTSIPSIS